MTPHVVTENGFEQQFQVCHLSHFLLFQLLKDMLIASSTSSFNSRVISVASSAHTFASVHLGDYNFEQHEDGYTPIAAYAQAKTANIWMANELERKYGSKGVHSISVHPGGIETGLQNSHDEASAAMIKEYLKLIKSMCCRNISTSKPGPRHAAFTAWSICLTTSTALRLCASTIRSPLKEFSESFMI